MDIGANIKRLRKEKDLSQEMLAERLGVTFQAVSRWERGESYPDITMLPALASFFDITLDELMGMSKAKEEAEIQEIISRLQEYDAHYEGDKMCSTIENALEKYPGNFELMAWYVYAFQRKNPQKAIEVGLYVLDHCTDDAIRNWVNSSIIYAYKRNNERDKAIELAKKLPNYYGTSHDVLRTCLEGTEQLEHVQHVIIDLAYEFWYSIRTIRNNYSAFEQIELFKKSNAIYDAIYEADDMPIKLVRKMKNYQGMAEVSLENNDVVKGMEYMRAAVHCAVMHDALPEMVHSKNMLYNVHPYERKWEACQDICSELLNDFETEDEFYKGIRDTEEYKAFIKELKISKS